ncbi:stage II sporulation protein P [Bacillus kexueae]|uniref:stage II sporulation protein P n=1 Tax=Aeribacillus kexueae TaxID=2078952 RepID=UPI001FAEE307|nr:stage II sporulation protein P [Bacillus kexueae]
MKRQGVVVTINGTSLIKYSFLLFVGLIVVFILTGMLTSLKPEYRPSSDSIHEFSSGLNGETFLKLLSMENHYFQQVLPSDSTDWKLSPIFFQLATSVNPDDPRSLLGRELPGFSIFDSKIVVAGEGTDYTNMPIESAPPTEVLLEEREASIENLQASEDTKKAPPPEMTTGNRKVVYIYNTHNTESYFPFLKVEDKSDPDTAFHSTANVTLVSNKLKDELEERGIGAQVEKENFQSILKEKAWDYGRSYSVSRPVIQDAIGQNREIQYLIDIHRDGLRYEDTTVTINGKSYAKIMFVVGGNNPNVDKNTELAKELHELFQQKYPGLSRGVIAKKGEGVNGVYNQDLSENAMLIEFGGVDNNMEELSRTAEAVAEVFSEYYWQAEKVNSSQ